jgi:hypothetical protein
MGEALNVPILEGTWHCSPLWWLKLEGKGKEEIVFSVSWW